MSSPCEKTWEPPCRAQFRQHQSTPANPFRPLPERRRSAPCYTAFYDHLVNKRQFLEKPCLLARSRGGLMLYSWAVEHPQSVGGVAGIYPVCNIASYPGLARAAGAFGLSVAQLEVELAQHNPIDRLKPLAEAGVPVLHIHGDSDKVVPLEANSAELAKRYHEFGGPVEIEVVEGQGHNMWEGWFTSQKLTDFAIARALGQPAEVDEAAVDLPKPTAHSKLDDEGDVARDSAGSQNEKPLSTPSLAKRKRVRTCIK